MSLLAEGPPSASQLLFCQKICFREREGEGLGTTAPCVPPGEDRICHWLSHILSAPGAQTQPAPQKSLALYGWVTETL